jgi:hypothetical protein
MGASAFPPDQVLYLDRARLRRPHGWDLLGLSVWDTAVPGDIEENAVFPEFKIPSQATLAPVWALDGVTLDRAHVSLVSASLLGSAPGNVPAIRWELRQGQGCILTTAVAGTILTGDAATRSGSLVQLGARQFSRLEFWARIDPGDSTTPAAARFRVTLDRVGQTPAPTTTVVTGVTVGGLQVLANLSLATITAVT